MPITVSRYDRVASTVLTLATLVALGLLIERRFNSSGASEVGKVEFVKDWKKSVAEVGVPLGDTIGEVQVAVFTDFECPYCARMDSTLLTLQEKYEPRLVLSLIHFPIRGHDFAIPAAHAFECARQQGRAAEMHHELYLSQNSFGKTDWVEFALRSKVADTTAFVACVGDKAAQFGIENGRKFADRLGGTRRRLSW